jgi:glutamate N-acetyltransferase/amino-acid N-acetyltransferase
MAVGSGEIKTLFPVKGLSIGVTCAGIKYPNRQDLVVMELPADSLVAGVFTQNAFCAAPVQICKQHLNSGKSIRYLLINTGNANAGTGQQGYKDAMASCQKIADSKGVAVESVLPFSTGVIGEHLPMDRLLAGIPQAFDNLTDNGWLNAANGIMTTDTRPKAVSQQFEFQGKTITVTGISKGAGMIKPNMATMLGFVATDAKVNAEVLQSILDQAVNQSFNRITIDGDTSTNDSCILMATGQVETDSCDGVESDLYIPLKQTIDDVMLKLAQAIVRDGEGATKFVTVQVDKAGNTDEALQVAYAIAHSPLVKTALTASDANWGRILAAVGYSGVKDLDVNQVELYLGDVCIARNGGRSEEYQEAQGAAVMAGEEILIRVVLNRGEVSDRVYTTDLSYDYIKINAEYRT